MRLLLFGFLLLSLLPVSGQAAGKVGVGVLLGTRVTYGIVWERAGAPSVRFSPTPGADVATGEALRNIEVLELPIAKPYWSALRYIIDNPGPIFLSVPDGAGLDGRRNLELVHLYLDVEQVNGQWHVTAIWASFSGSRLNPAGEPPIPNPGRLEHNLTYAVAEDQKTRVLDLREAEPPWPTLILHDFNLPLYFESQLVYGRSMHVMDEEPVQNYQKSFGISFGDNGWQQLFATDFSIQGYDLTAYGIARSFPWQSRCVRVLLNSLKAETVKAFLPSPTRSQLERGS
ncbi:MAG: hypothetical protein R3B54_00030 [Bdellovibrionota bacterium]